MNSILQKLGICYEISKLRIFAIHVFFIAVVMLGTIHPVEAMQANDNIILQNRNQIEKLVSESQGAEKIIERELVFNTLRPSDGKMEVIVMLDSIGRTTKSVNWKLQSSRNIWQTEVSNAQKQVLNNLNKDDIEVRKVYINFPCFYAAVNTNALITLMKDPRVRHIEPVRKFKPVLRQGIELMNAESIRTASGGEGVAIAILDSGVDYTHPQLGNGSFPNNKVISGRDVANNDNDPYPSGSALESTKEHGTACAGIAAGNIRQPSIGDYIGGVAPDAKIIAVKVFRDNEEQAYNYVIQDGIDWCVTNQYLDPDNPIMVINMSIAGDKYSSAWRCNVSQPALLNAVNAAVDAGITVLASSGNDGYCDSIGSPAALSPVISVGAVYDASIGNVGFCLSSDTCYSGASPNDQCDNPTKPWAAWEGTTFAKKVACYSNSASFLDIFAPSNNAYTTKISGSPGYDGIGNFKNDFGGTSAACAYAAGAVALLQSTAQATRGAFLTPEEIRDLLTSTGELITDTKNGGLSGFGKPFLDVYAAFEAIPPLTTTYVDIGLRYYDGTQIVHIACEQGTPTSSLRISKNGVTYGIVLVDTGDPHASKIIIQTSSGPKAIRKLQ